jgi:hypothetical protein
LFYTAKTARKGGCGIARILQAITLMVVLFLSVRHIAASEATFLLAAFLSLFCERVA